MNDVYRLHVEQWVKYPPELVFPLLSDPTYLPDLMPRWSRARIERTSIKPSSSRPEHVSSLRETAAETGTNIVLSLQPIPFIPARMQWEAEVDEFVWNHCIADIQHRGPFRTWRHRQSIRAEKHAENPVAIPKPGTLLINDVVYSLPFGEISSIANALIVQRLVLAFLRHRHSRILELLPRVYPAADRRRASRYAESSQTAIALSPLLKRRELR